MIEYVTGDIFNSGCDALVNPVNCVGVMGKGLAAEFKRRYPGYYLDYLFACRVKQIQEGFIRLFKSSEYPDWPIIYSFASKDHWRDKSDYRFIYAGLRRLAASLAFNDIKSVALPAVGCGNGGLNWDDVKPHIEAAFRPFPEITVKVYEPR